jgi:Fur family transcriptional regulator, ferric uptake regulator
MDVTTEQIIKDLRKKGYRITPQREKILKLFYELPEGTHLSADEIMKMIKAAKIKISTATLYRTLNLLSSMGLLRELDFAEDHKHYELHRGKASYHHHIICVGCSKTVEVSDKNLVDLGEKLALDHNFELRDIQFKLFGLCKNCQNKED